MEQRWGDIAQHLIHDLRCVKNSSEVRLICRTCRLELYRREIGRYGLAPIPPPIAYKPPRGQDD